MLATTRELTRKARVVRNTKNAIGSGLRRLSTVPACRVPNVRRTTMPTMKKKNMRWYSLQEEAEETEEQRNARRIRDQNTPPPFSGEVTLDTVNDVTSDYEHLRQFLPIAILDDELAVVEARAARAKLAGRMPNIADSTWIMLAALKRNKVPEALSAFQDLAAIRTPEILYWNFLFSHALFNKQIRILTDLYENFKLQVIKRKLPGPAQITYNILLKAFSERGDLERVMEIYEDMFNNRWIPEIHHIVSVLKTTALAGEPKLFHRFMSRLKHKGFKVSRQMLKTLFNSWGRTQVSIDQLKKSFVTTGDYAAVIEYALRANNYRRAYELLVQCRDGVGIQPDARVYEVILTAMINDNFQREKARALKKRFHKYPKGIEVREEHFEFNELFESVLNQLGKDATDAKAVDPGERIKFARTTRKMTSRMFNPHPEVRYESGWEYDEFEWVPEYVKRKEELQLAREQAAKAAELEAIVQKAQQQASTTPL